MKGMNAPLNKRSMRKTVETYLKILGSIILVYVQAGCGRNEQASAPISNQGYLATNTLINGVEEEVIILNNGVLIRWNGSNVDLLFGRLDGTILTALIDPASSRLNTVVLTRGNTNRVPYENIFDKNADGIPEKRTFAGDRSVDYFYKGAWYPKDAASGKTDAIRVDGKSVVLRYDGTNWTEAPHE